MSFNELGLSPTLLQAVEDTGYTIPTPIQIRAIPAILSGSDVMAAAQTGTGKTAGFTLPLLQLLGGKAPAKSNHVRALVLTPTRELAAQIQESIETYGKHEKLRSVVVFGGVNINPQQLALRKGCDILVATPGRLLDLYQQNCVKFTDLEILVLDEADRMLDMGFIRDIRKILALLPSRRQNLMFSATFSDDIRTLAKTICHKPQEIDVAPRNSTVETVTQQVYEVSKDKKLPLLGKLLQETSEQVLVFSRTKHGANNLVKKLAGFDVQAAAIHGNKSQSQRTKALADFKANKVQVLVATDIAARGIDIDLLAMVINFDLTQVAEDYVHRIGRTGRAGQSGLAVSLVCDDDRDMLREIERLIKRKIERVTFDPRALPVAKAVATPPADSQPAAPRQHKPRQSQNKPQGARQGQGRQGSRTQSANHNHSNTSSDSAYGNRQGASEGRSAAQGSRPRRPRSGGGGNSNQPRSQDQQPRQPVSGNREGASFAPKAKAQTEQRGFWKKLSSGKLFSRH